MLTKACILEDERAVKQAVLKQYPVLKEAIGFEYGYKIMVLKMLDEFNNREEDVSVSHRHEL
jgi:hypothetical protein